VHQEQEQGQQQEQRRIAISTPAQQTRFTMGRMRLSGIAAGRRDCKLPLLEKRGIKVKTASCAPISGDPVTTRSSSLPRDAPSQIWEAAAAAPPPKAASAEEVLERCAFLSEARGDSVSFSI
jgi:hypothetical protein